MAKISVIIPVYNVEQYISKCARSLFQQTLEDIEYIFIDDGSVDESISILYSVVKEFPDRADWIKVISFGENRGVFEAIKEGLANCSGEYVIRCDSDDWVPDMAYETMYHEAKKEDADVVECAYYTITERGDLTEVINSISGDCVAGILVGDHPSYLWNKMFHSSLIEKIKYYSEGNMWDDIPIAIQCVVNCKKNIYISTPLYYYLQRDSSICHNDSSSSIVSKWKGAVNNAKIVIKYLTEKGMANRYKKEVTIFKLRSMFYAYPIAGIKEYKSLE